MQLIVRDTASAALAAIGARLKNKQPISEAAGFAVVQLTARSFHDPSVRAAPWAPLAPATIAQKLADNTTVKFILGRSGLLSKSFRVVEAGNDFVRVGSDRWYAAFHQLGTNRGLPARPMLPVIDNELTPLAVRNVVAAAQAKLAELLRR